MGCSAESRLESAPMIPVLVLGGGPAGMTLALLLAREGIDVLVVDGRPVESLQQDRRLLALSHGTLLALEGLLGKDFAPLAPIGRVHVSSAGQPGAARLEAADVGTSRLGATTWYADLVGALARAVQASARVRMLRPLRVERIDQDPHGVRVRMADGSVLEGCLAVDAEGTPGGAAPPGHAALLADLTIDALDEADAVERFTPHGPLALLPLPRAREAAPVRAARSMSMIWCLAAHEARALAALDEAALRERIAAALGARLGRPRAIGPRHVFPLTTHRLERVVEHRLVHVGNAAQSLHPVAGQGFNLAIRDCLGLAQCLAEAFSAASNPDIGRALAAYARRRRLDRWLVPTLTGALPRVFTSKLAPVVHARGIALGVLDLVPELRRAFTRLMMFGPG